MRYCVAGLLAWMLFTLTAASHAYANDNVKAETLVYLHGSTLYQSHIDQDEGGDVVIRTQAISGPEESIRNFVMSGRVCLAFVHQGTRGEAIHREMRQGLDIVIVDLSLLPEINAAGSIAFNGQSVVYVSIQAGQYSLHSLDVGTGQQQLLLRQEGVVLAPSLSPDGNWIAFYSDQGEGVCLYVVDVLGERRRQLASPSQATDFGGPMRLPPTWSEDSRRIFFHGWYEGNDIPGLYAASVADAEFVPRQLMGGLCTSIDVTRNIAYLVKSGVHALDINKEQSRLVMQEGWWPSSSPNGSYLAYYKSGALYVRKIASGTDVSIVDPYRGDGRQVSWLDGEK